MCVDCLISHSPHLLQVQAISSFISVYRLYFSFSGCDIRARTCALRARVGESGFWHFALGGVLICLGVGRGNAGGCRWSIDYILLALPYWFTVAQGGGMPILETHNCV